MYRTLPRVCRCRCRQTYVAERDRYVGAERRQAYRSGHRVKRRATEMVCNSRGPLSRQRHEEDARVICIYVWRRYWALLGYGGGGVRSKGAGRGGGVGLDPDLHSNCCVRPAVNSGPGAVYPY
ncbi:hypothetical protein CCHR01_16815 [Colletotrichum chrysophilum]|uniref:Uncharacterized protein n=1 Tax=Colletotrichum chrysophilum TaxID=1836956 RepID=A0AAD9A4Y1_9PEZI|nr:hypothetical protein CCHR01_16815 [Colletotrichum chrysophilum]